ncbi:hypothetical protein EDB87DRAFT_1834738 [Lactarius vividus]|nr:hypothetical protein EDB87DRAFT_1834738 [Lactarius vividus]
MRRVKAKFHPHSPPEPQRPPPSESPPRPAPDAPPVAVASPISRVPAELLMEIFTHVPRMEFEESLRAHAAGVRPRPTWMSIAQVCRHWRAIVANFKDFWAYIPLQTSAYWAEWYRRAALSALRAVARAQEVHLRISAATNLELRMEALNLLSGSPAPKLETLSVDGTMARSLVLLSDDNFPRCHNAVVALRSLTLAYCDVRPSNVLFHAPLVFLHLENCQADSLLEVLSRLPHLRRLILENAPFHDAPPRNSSNVVHLQQLQHFAITNTSGIVAFLIKGILTSPSTSLSITCTDYADIDEPLDDAVLLHIITSTLSAVLSAHFERALGAGYSFPLLEITTPSSTYKRTLTLRDPVSDLPGASRPIPALPQLQLSLAWGDASADLFSALLSAFPAAALRRVHTLGMRDDPPHPSLRAADGRSRPQPFAESHEKARDEAVRGLLAIVAMHGVLPALHGVSLEGIDLDNTDIDSLVRVLLARRRRALAGEPIRLTLRDCLASKGTIQALRNYLGSGVVDWG